MKNEDLRNQYAGMAMQAMISRHEKDAFSKDALPGIIELSVLAADMLLEGLKQQDHPDSNLVKCDKDDLVVGGWYWTKALSESGEAWERVMVSRLSWGNALGMDPTVYVCRKQDTPQRVDICLLFKDVF